MANTTQTATCLICVNVDDYPPYAKHLAAQATCVIACDGAIHHCTTHAISVDIHIGDMDSTTSIAHQHIRKLNTTIAKNKVHIAEQNTTDLEKALNYAIAHNYAHIDVIGIHGGRFDHSIYHLQLMWCYAHYARIVWHSCQDQSQVHSTHCNFQGNIGQNISFFAPWNKASISLIGAKYPVTDYAMSPTGPSSLSNAFANVHINCHIHHGDILVCQSQ